MGSFHTGSRQATRLRRQYFHAVLRQEPAYFDVHATTGELLQGLNEDTSAIQLAIGEKARLNHQRGLLFMCSSLAQHSDGSVPGLQMGNFVDKIVTFCVGMAIGGTPDWSFLSHCRKCTIVLAHREASHGSILAC